MIPLIPYHPNKMKVKYSLTLKAHLQILSNILHDITRVTCHSHKMVLQSSLILKTDLYLIPKFIVRELNEPAIWCKLRNLHELRFSTSTCF